MTTFIAGEGSTILDVCLNTYGTLDYLVKLMVDNNHPSVNDRPVKGTAYVFDETLVSVTNKNTNLNYNGSVTNVVGLDKYTTAP